MSISCLMYSTVTLGVRHLYSTCKYAGYHMFTMKFPALGSPLRMFRSAYSLIARHCVQIGVRTRTITTLFQDTQKSLSHHTRYCNHHTYSQDRGETHLHCTLSAQCRIAMPFTYVSANTDPPLHSTIVVKRCACLSQASPLADA
jgi:hypothetical protein